MDREEQILFLANWINDVDEARRLVEKGFITTRDLARLADCHPSTASRWIRKKTSIPFAVLSIEEAIQVLIEKQGRIHRRRKK